MFTVRVSPIARGVPLDELTFFSRDAIQAGSIVQAEIRKRVQPCLVLSSHSAAEDKLALKSTRFTLKKISGHARLVVAPYLIRALERVSVFYRVPLGAVLAELTFTSLLSVARKLPELQNQSETQRDTPPEVLILQAEPEGRIGAYKNLTRETFARGRSLTLIAPSLVEVDALAKELSRGIEESVVVLTSALTPKKLRAAWERVVTATTPMLVIGTPPALSVPVPNLDVVIVERESARSYITRHIPPLSLRLAAEYVAREAGARLVLADYPVRVETRARLDAHTAEELIRAQVRPAGAQLVTVIDTRAHDAKLKERRTFTPLSINGRDEVRAVLARKGRVAIFSARKGIAPLTVCNDCGTPVTDPTTGTPMTLIKTPTGNMFVSRQTGALVPSHTVCRTCGSWNLVTLGIGVDRVVEYVKREFPKSAVITFTKDTTPSHKAALKLSQNFYDTEGAIMVGTERMLPYLTEPIEQVVVASIDTTLSLPAWRAGEYALQTLSALRTKALESLIIETRKPDNPVIRAIASGNIADYYRDELELRSSYGYPPFSLFISLFWTGTESQCKDTADHIAKTFAHRDLVGPLPPEIIDRGRLEQRATLRINPHSWPDEVLSQELDSLPRDIRVIVDPEDIV